MTRTQELFAGCVDGARMARDSARMSRRMARDWPRDAIRYESQAHKDFARAYAYLDWARGFRSAPYAAE